jgi:protein SCO1/2
MDRREFFVAASATAVATFAIASSGKSAQPQDGVEWFTNAEVTTQTGKSLRFYDDALKGKILLINFFYTDNGTIGPRMTRNLCHVQELLGPRVGKDVFMLSISLRPEHDTPGLMAAYAKTYAVGPGWSFLTGKKQDIELIRHRLGFFDIDPAEDADPEQQMGTVRIANEPLHRWIVSPGLVSPEALVRSVKRVVPEPV